MKKTEKRCLTLSTANNSGGGSVWLLCALSVIGGRLVRHRDRRTQNKVVRNRNGSHIVSLIAYEL